MDKRQQIWKSLADKEYRESFAEDVGTGIAFQIKLMREKRGWNQEDLAQRTGKKQEVISQLENPNYGRFSLATLKKIAAAFDVGLIVKFAPFSELVAWLTELSPQKLVPPSYEEEHQMSFADVEGVSLAWQDLGHGISPTATSFTMFLDAYSDALKLQWDTSPNVMVFNREIDSTADLLVKESVIPELRTEQREFATAA